MLLSNRRITYSDLQAIAPDQYMKKIHQRLAATKSAVINFFCLPRII